RCKSRYVPEYKFPTYMGKGEQANNKKQGDRGFELYKKFCGECHGITARGSNKIPNFTKAQLNKYEDAFRMNKGDTHLKFKKMRDRDLEDIFIFLEFRVKQ
ncbi:MAG: c-type cytochrome, partial [Bacteroidia bacterium]